MTRSTVRIREVAIRAITTRELDQICAWLGPWWQIIAKPPHFCFRHVLGACPRGLN